jgi:hypothetical protein
MVQISGTVALPDTEIEIVAIRAQGAQARRTCSSHEKRLDSKIKRGKTKVLRRKYQQLKNEPNTT